MKVKDITNLFSELSPLAYAEDFDNVGLLVGDPEMEVKGILVTLDTLEAVVDEAIEKECNLIISFHPIIFAGLKKITGRTYVERVVQKAIKNDIAIYSNHTALDNSWNGVNDMICTKLNLENRQILIPQKNTIKKLITFVPVESAEKVRSAIFNAGGGSIGNYDHCSFNIRGEGSFKGNDDSNPVIGEKGITHFEPEIQLGITFPKHRENAILKALFTAHPYEEVAYEITTLENTNQHIGMGMIGFFAKPMAPLAFLELLKTTMKAEGIRHSEIPDKPIQKIAVLGGSGSFAIEAAIAAGDKAAAQDSLKAAEVELMKASTKGVLHKNNSSRKVSRLSKSVNAMQ